ncbi:MAG TPA: SAM-dependent methyltransferase, partial [Micromonosporaceae bacterium]|nr:SAM-dependent methyltransferase [Micromonosporaceae bacterium]
MTTADLFRPLQRRYESFFADRPPISFAVTTADGTTRVLGPDRPAFTITVKDGRGARALASLDQFAVAVSYLRGWLDLDGDLVAALRMRNFMRDIHPIALLSEYLPALLRGKAHDRESISHHYDEDSDFFLTFLDQRHRCYTEGVFARD